MRIREFRIKRDWARKHSRAACALDIGHGLLTRTEGCREDGEEESREREEEREEHLDLDRL